jgi:hypothetical protein
MGRKGIVVQGWELVIPHPQSRGREKWTLVLSLLSSSSIPCTPPVSPRDSLQQTHGESFLLSQTSSICPSVMFHHRYWEMHFLGDPKSQQGNCQEWPSQNTSDLSWSPAHRLRLQMWTSVPVFLHGFLESELRSSGLHGGHFSKWATFPPPPFLFF